MFYEKFDLDDEGHAAEYSSEQLMIIYNMQQIISEEQFIGIVTEEWLHGLIDWCMEGLGRATTEKEDHWVLRELGFD